MSYKDILVVLDAAEDSQGRLDLAAALAERCGAHLVGLYPVPHSELPSYAGYPDLLVLQSLDRQWRDRVQAQADTWRQRFERLTRQHGLSAEWREVPEGSDADPALHARYADLAILGQLDPERSEMALIRPPPERAALATGRPILVVPYAGQFASVGRNVLIGWDASREATRAVADAMPLLETAEAVTVLAIDPHAEAGGRGEAAGADIARHLERHGVKATVERTASAGVPVGDVLLSRAADLGADLLVMGLYGHSRARELLLGGATRTVLNSMTVPTLMSH